MHVTRSHLLSLYALIATAAGQINLLDYATDGVGNILGTYFGTAGTNATYDYVIVGGGNAGLAIATRLAEDPSISVAVIEAGGFYETDNGNRSVVPGYANYFTGSDPENYQPLIDWGFSTVPQPSTANRTVHYARGKTLGGSSARNYMIYHRPTVGSLKMWADEVGDQSYTWDQFLPYYKKSCNYTSFDPGLYNATILPQPDNVFDPAGGPLHVSYSNYADSFGSWAQKAFIGVGMALQNLSLNAGVLNGSAFSTLTINPTNGHRSSSESSFLQAALQNGTAPIVYKNSLAQKILFNDTTATGVLVSTAGSYGTKPINFTLTARKEVIVSAGTFQSPQLLMVSGIGPKTTLQQYGIQVIKDLAGVGQNMWDHVLFGVNRRVNVLTASASINNPLVAARGVELFRTNASGPLAAFGAGYYGWEKLPDPYRTNLSSNAVAALSAFPSDWPELEWLPISAYLGYQTNRQKEDPRDGYNYATINPGIIAPLSRGNVTISSAEMTDPPVLSPNWLEDPTDREIAVLSFKRSREIWAQLTGFGITNGDAEYLPGLNVTSDADILEYIEKSLMTIYHASSTCKMGNATDPMAVVDSRARVYGVKNLRVVDASAFPFLPPGHPMSTVYALAEKIAADILGGGNATTPPGYNLEGYYLNQQLVMEHEANLTGGGKGGNGGTVSRQAGAGEKVGLSRGSMAAAALCAVSSWFVWFV
ncbi:MAG: hypothetical protein LQ352_003698 [Teloschistes flavicans]|nr:MAG: hypothetical protein LQ352_003698 [Teloschistes flavicans]